MSDPIEVEYLTSTTLVEIDDGLWVNPSRVVAVRTGLEVGNQGSLRRDETKTILEFGGNERQQVDKPLAEVVAIINGWER